MACFSIIVTPGKGGVYRMIYPRYPIEPPYLKDGFPIPLTYRYGNIGMFLPGLDGRNDDALHTLIHYLKIICHS